MNTSYLNSKANHTQEGGRKVILNLLPIAAGGGLQNALSLLRSLAEEPQLADKCVALVQSAALVKECKVVHIEHVAIPQGAISRLVFEMQSRVRFSQGQLCFTLFGPPLLLSSGFLLNVTGCAYSNLFYPEINFWEGYYGIGRCKRKLVDTYRGLMLRRSDYWIFETEALSNRAVNIFGLPRERVGVVRMAPSKLVSPEQVSGTIAAKFETQMPKRFRFLFLSSPARNKRLHLLPKLAEIMIRKGHTNFCFVTTLDSGSQYSREIASAFATMHLENYSSNLGPVPQHEISSLISRVDAMCTFSVLESFSNNFIEAWKMRKPLIVTDADWSRSSCGDGALYLDLGNLSESADRLIQVLENGALRADLVGAGGRQLATYPTPQEKLKLYFEQLGIAARLGGASLRN